MRYLAILKDSIREALDSKILYVLFVLSTFAILIVATISCKPLSAQKTMEQFFPTTSIQNIKISLLFMALNKQELERTSVGESDLKSPTVDGGDVIQKMILLHDYKLDKVELLHGTPDAPESEYALTVVELFGRVNRNEDRHAALDKGAARVRSIFEKAEQLGYFKIASVTGDVAGPAKNKSGGRMLYRVTLQGTPMTFRIWAHEPRLLFGLVPMEFLAAPLGYQLYVLARGVLLIGSWFAILVGVVITSFFIPSMLSKGTVDMLLVKPIQRWTLLVYKYVGGLTFIFLNMAYAIAGMWLVLGLRTGLWANGLFLLVLTMTFFFAILYAISTFVGVATRSTIAAILVTIMAWIFFFAIGYAHDKFEARSAAEQRREKRGESVPQDERWGDSNTVQSLNLLRALTPRTEDLNHLNDLIIYSDFMTGRLTSMRDFDTSGRDWWEPLFVASTWIFLCLAFSCLWFTCKDY